MSENITREQYDNAVRIRDNGYCCLNLPMQCAECFTVDIPCGESHKPLELRKAVVDNRISIYEAAHPEESRASPDPGEGWRYLKIGEVLEPTDEVYDSDELGWVKTCYRDSVYQNELLTYRRRLAKPPRIYDYRDVDLPEVRALIGERVYSSSILSHMIKGKAGWVYFEGLSNQDSAPFQTSGGYHQFIRAIDEPPKIKLTRAELIAIAAKDRGVKPEQIVVEE